MRLRLRRAWAAFSEQGREQIQGQRQERNPAALRRDFLHRLQEAQLQGDGLGGDHAAGFDELGGGLKLPFGIDDFGPAFPFALGLAGHVSADLKFR